MAQLKTLVILCETDLRFWGVFGFGHSICMFNVASFKVVKAVIKETFCCEIRVQKLACIIGFLNVN